MGLNYLFIPNLQRLQLISNFIAHFITYVCYPCMDWNYSMSVKRALFLYARFPNYRLGLHGKIRKWSSGNFINLQMMCLRFRLCIMTCDGSDIKVPHQNLDDRKKIVISTHKKSDTTKLFREFKYGIPRGVLTWHFWCVYWVHLVIYSTSSSNNSGNC